MIRLIAAIDNKRGIAKYGFQPWYIPDDENYFTELTKERGGNVLYGSRTFELSLVKKPLPGRQNYLLTHHEKHVGGVKVINDLQSFLADFSTKDLWVIGGENIYLQVIEMGKAYELYITQIDADFGCDQFFPKFENTHHLVQETTPKEQNGFTFSYQRYAKN